MPAPPRRSRPSTTSRIWRTRRWSRRRRPSGSPTASARSGPACRARRPRATDVAKRLGMSPENVTVHVTLLGGGFGRKSKPDFAIEAALAVARDGRRAGQGACGRARTTSSNGYLPHRLGRAHRGRARRGRQAGRVAAPQRRAEHRARSSRPIPKHERTLELGMGLVDMPFDVANLRIENGEAAAHDADRLVPLGLEHSARLRGPVLRRRRWRQPRARTRRTICWS